MAKATPRRKRVAKPEPKKLTAKQGAFAMEYVVDMNATQAAIRAGFSEKTAAQQGWQLLQNPLVAAEIAKLKAERAERLKIDADQLLARLVDEAHADFADLFDADGALKPIHDWPLIWRTGLIAGIEIEEEYDTKAEPDEMEEQAHGGALRRPRATPRAIGRVAKIKISDKIKRLELIGRHQSVQAWRERKVVDVTDPVKQLFEQIAGKAIRPGGSS